MKWEKQSRELTLKMPWGHIAAKAYGSNKDTPVLMVHGSLDNAGSFSRLIELLPQNYYYIAIDLPGHGLSSHFPPGMILDFFNYVLAIKYVLDELQWNECLYIGHSFGAQLGIMLSIIYPNKLKRIVAIDGFFPRIVKNENLLTKIRQTNEMVVFDLNKSMSRLYSKSEILNTLKNKRQFHLNELAALALFERSVTMIGDKYKYNRDLRLRQFVYPNLNFDQYLELLKHLTVPALIILASVSMFDSPENGLNTEDLKKLLPNVCTIVTVEGNHDVHNNNPERVEPYIRVHLNDNLRSKL